ncbi:unnamed protein product [Ceutorhynchus assimilis]|uniref:Uncharacterized protein n=1 Tax=Ceutorhynchus assimilis TaxID=467358 RepID=A0A9N9QFB2_9CUCU|nr:unnamed protein product [Ceutorhynchus assimilis]
MMSQQVRKIKVEFKNIYEIDEFLLSNTRRIFSIQTCDSKLEVNRILNILEQLQLEPTFENSAYSGAENVSVLNWTQLKTQLTEESDTKLANLTIIDVLNYKKVDPEHKKTLRKLFENISNTEIKKVILVSASESICTENKYQNDANFFTEKKVSEISFRDLSDKTQKQCLQIYSIFFQKETITLEEFLRKNDLLNEESLNNIITSTVLNNIMMYNKKTIPIGICNDQKNYFKDFYIQRTFCNQYFVSKKIWKLLVSKIEVNDTWIFSGVNDQRELIEILKIPSKKASKLCENIHMFKHFKEAKVYFDKLPSCRPIHLIKYENDQFLWINSKGFVDKLRKYIFKNHSSILQLSDLLNYKTVILNGPLGIGKSTTLSMLSTYPFWFLNIRFSNCNEMIASIPKIINRQTLIEFLTNYIGPNFLAHGLLNFFLYYNSKIRIYLLFDDLAGNIDLDTYKSFLQLLVFIKEKSNAFIWISSKPENCIDLENNLSTFSTSFNDINKDEIQHIFHKNELTENTHLYYKNNKKLFNNKQKLLGVPLLCDIISKLKNPTIKCQNIEELFSNFIESKIEKYMSEHFSNSNHKTEIINYIKEIHGVIALKLFIYPEFEDNKNMAFHINITKVGFVVLRMNGNYEFTDEAVANYFIANKFYVWISAPSSPIEKNLLCKFLLERQYALIRVFLNYFIKLGKPPAMPQNVKHHIVKLFQENTQNFFNENHACTLQILMKEKLFLIIEWFFPKEILELIHPYLNKNKAFYNYFENHIKFPCQSKSHRAVLNGLKDNLEIKIPVDIVDRNNATPIQYAATNGSLDIVKFLKSKNANVNHKDNKSKTALIRAIEKNHIEIVEFLVEDKATDKDCQDKNGISALEYAAISKNTDLIKYLSDTNVNHVDNFGMTALCWAVKVGDLVMTDYLIKIGSNLDIKDEHGSNLLNIAMKSKQWHLIKYLTFCLVNVNMADFNQTTPLERAVKSNQWDFVKYLILEGASLPNNFNPIKNAAEAEQWDLIKLMLEHQGNLKDISMELTENILNLFVNASFAELIQLGNVDVLDLLIQRGKFDDHNLDRLLSEPYEELLFENKTALHTNMKIFVEEMLVKLRSKKGQKFKLSEKDTETRINLVCEQISLIENVKEINKEFITRARLIAQNIELLKRAIRKSNIPWEQMEFCIIIFINFFLNPQQEDFVYRLVLDQDKLILYLKSFSMFLLKREAFPKMEDLETDYRILKDIYSLNRISSYIKLALSVSDNKEIMNTYVLMRCLQVIGESFKKTTDSPNLSPEIHQFLILSAPTNVGQIVTSLRDSLSHSDAYKQKITIENKLKTDLEFFQAVKNDLKKILLQIDFLLFTKKKETLEMFRQKCLKNPNNLNNINQYINWESYEIKSIEEYEINDIKVIQKLFEKLKLANKNSNKQELELISKLSKEISFIEKTIFTQLKDVKEKYYDMRSDFRSLDEAQHSQSLPKLTIDLCIKRKEGIYYEAFSILVDLIKVYQNNVAENTGKKLDSIQICFQLCYIMKWDAHKIKNIQEIHSSLSGKLEENSIDKILDCIKNYLENEADRNIFKEHIIEKKLLHESFKKLKQNPINELIDQLNIVIKEKINLKKSLRNNKPQIFKEIISNMDDYGKLIKNYASEKFFKVLKTFFSPLKSTNIENAILLVIKQEDKEFEQIAYTKLTLLTQYIKENDRSLNLTLQSAIEILLLDVMEACITKNAIIEYNISFNEFSPMLVGTALRNYLAHGTPLIDTLPFDPLNAILATARLLEEKKENLFETVTSEPLIENTCDKINKAQQDTNNVIENIITNDDVKCFESIIKHRKMSLCNYFLNATSKGAINIIKHILKFDKIIVPSILIWPSIIIASKNGHGNMVRLFLNNHDDSIHQANFDRNSFKNFENILSSNFDIQISNNNKKLIQQLIDKSFELAATNGHLTIASLLLKYNPDINYINNENLSILHLAAKNGHSEIIKLLISNNADITTNSTTPLHLASLYCHSEAVKVLLKHESINIDAQIENEDFTPLHLAARYGSEEIANILLDNGANIDAVTINQSTALHLSALYNRIEVAKILLQRHANVNVLDKCNASPLLLAAARGYEDLVKVLLEYNANPLMELEGYRPLHMCALYGHSGIANILLEHDQTQIDIPSSDRNQFTALHFAALAGHIDVVDVLLKHHCNKNCADNDNFTPLHISSLHGHKEIAKLLLQHQVDINVVCFPTQSTALHMAASHGHEEIVEVLLQNDANINAQDSSGKTALHLAAGYGYKAVLNVLLEYHAEVNCETNERATPLHLAAEDDHEEVVGLLIKAGANVNAQDKKLFAPLHFAAQNGHDGVANILIQNDANVDIRMLNHTTPLHTSAQHGQINIVKLLLKNKCNINATTISKFTALHLAVVKGHEVIAGLLIDYKAEINVTLANNTSVLHYACEAGRVNIVKLLLQNHANVNVAKEGQNVTPLHIAAQQGHEKVVRLLLEHEATNINAITREEATALHLAVENGHLAVVQVLLQFNVDVNAASEGQFTPIHIAAQCGHKDIAELLIEHECDVDAVLSSQHTPLHLATQNGHQSLVEVLIKNQANVNATDDKLATPLHLAAHHGHEMITLILLTYQANVNAQAIAGYTPLHAAAFRGHEQVVAMLLAHGADANATETDLATPLHYAVENGHENIVDLLCSGGANVEALKSGQSSTPLHSATEKGFLGVVKILIKHNANVNALRNRDTPLYSTANMLLRNDVHYIMKETALSIAIQNKREDIRACLLKNGAINGFEYINH